jgi:hypothetical protein
MKNLDIPESADLEQRETIGIGAYTPLYLRLPKDGASAPKHVAVI